ncbi:hypothetical protein CARUB_v10024140mg [Capsella rubella]|uniref:Cyclin-dependent kinase inhibitor domain-containing protein n=1 Tax=Capsella rubella TaxID=81985 RepID=R0HEG8_9BRAS|nr:cyclin-dependent kinase inhibitor 1 [Capsella rubella]EOA27969.1 hypothetical protein CARUB_v10024140mg [Capsella rubella]
MVRKCRKGKGLVESGVSSTYMQLRSRRIVYIRSEKASSVFVDGEDNGVLSSCCGSNEYKKNIDLEIKEGDTETSTYRRRRKRKLFEDFRDEEEEERSKSMESYSSEFETAIKEPLDCCCSGRVDLSTTAEKENSRAEMPTESEIDDFFAVAEKVVNEKFKKKYNFDFEKEKPLEGRYEWVKLE